MVETFRRYIPKSEVAALNAELAEWSGAQQVGSSKQEATERTEGEAGANGD